MQTLNALQQNILNLTTLLVIPWLAKRYTYSHWYTIFLL